MRRWAVAGLLIALFAAGCGGNDEEEVRSVISQLGNSDPAVCEKATDRFLDQLGGTVEKCRRQAEQSKSKVKIGVEKVTVDGEKSTVNADVAGSKGTIKLVKDGDWKIDSIAEAPSGSGR